MIRDEIIALTTADEYLLDYFWPSVERLMEKGFIWYGLVRSPSIAPSYMNRSIYPLHLKSYVKPQYRAQARKWVKRVDLADPASWRISGVPLGDYFEYEAQRYSVRKLRNRSKLRHILEWSVCMTLGMLDLIQEIEPDIMVIWNGSQYPHSVFKAVAETMGIPAFYVERGYMPQTHVLNEAGVNAKARLSRAIDPTPEQLEETERLIERVVTNGLSVVNSGNRFSAEEIRRYLGVKLNKPLLLYPAQIDSDTNIVLHSSQYKTNQQAVKDIVAALRGRGADYHLVVKPHPEDTTNNHLTYERLLERYGSVVEGVDIASLLSAVDGVVVRNSTAGFEALLRRLPVITMGEALYAGSGATLEARSREDLNHCLDRLTSLRGPEHWRQKVLPTIYHLLSKYHVFFQDDLESFKVDCSPLQKLTSTALGRKSRSGPRPSGHPRPSICTFTSKYIERFAQAHIVCRSGPILVVDHTTTYGREPALDCLLGYLDSQKVYLVTGLDRKLPPGVRARLFDKESVRETAILLARRFSLMVIIAPSRFLVSRKVQLFTRLCRASEKYVIETDGSIVPVSQRSLGTNRHEKAE